MSGSITSSLVIDGISVTIFDIPPRDTLRDRYGNYIAPYFFKEGDVRAQVKCRYCEFNSVIGGTIRKCSITRNRCKKGYIFCDHFRLHPDMRELILKSKDYSGEPLPLRGGWLKRVEPFHSL